jgi:hypothetical protein
VGCGGDFGFLRIAASKQHVIMMDMKIISKGRKMGAQGWLVWADRAYFGFAIIAAIATGITIVAGIAQNRLSARISNQKDRNLKAYQIAADLKIASADKAAAEANEATAKANLKIANLLRQDEPRHFPEDEKTALLLESFGKQNFSVYFASLDADTQSLALEMWLNLTGEWYNMDVPKPLPIRASFNFWSVGVTVVINSEEPKNSRVTAAANALAKILYAHGLAMTSVAGDFPGLAPIGSIAVIVGEKPPINLLLNLPEQ